MHLYIRELDAEMTQQEKVIHYLQGNLKIEIENSRKIKESANKMHHAMKSKELFVGRQDSDDIIYSRFQTLVGQIKTWSIPFAQGRVNIPGEFSREAINHIRRVLPLIESKNDLEEFLETPKHMRLFVRGYVGFAMADYLFRSLPHAYAGFHDTDVWMNQHLVQPVATLEETLLRADRDLSSDPLKYADCDEQIEPRYRIASFMIEGC